MNNPSQKDSKAENERTLCVHWSVLITSLFRLPRPHLIKMDFGKQGFEWRLPCSCLSQAPIAQGRLDLADCLAILGRYVNFLPLEFFAAAFV